MEGVCYSGAAGKNSQAFVVDVAPNDATSVYFPIVPLEMGKFPVRVFAISAWGRDAEEKILRVEVSRSAQKGPRGVMIMMMMILTVMMVMVMVMMMRRRRRKTVQV